ncbi:MAG: DUF1566 domain-containing protein [Desulfuromonadales bacterium]|nr:DUF1566 domain-containing protein [Desulfuromonadales bacterium]
MKKLLLIAYGRLNLGIMLCRWKKTWISVSVLLALGLAGCNDGTPDRENNRSATQVQEANLAGPVPSEASKGEKDLAGATTLPDNLVTDEPKTLISTEPEAGKKAGAEPETADGVKIEAEAAVREYTLNYSAEKNGALSGARLQKVREKKDGTPVKAIAQEGYDFVSWSDGILDNPRTDLAVTADLSATARFAVRQYTLHYSAGENGAISGTILQTIDHGSSGAAVSATPRRGYHFVRWSDGVTTAERTDTNLAGDLEVYAEFAVNTYTLGGTVSGLAVGTAVVLQNGGGDPLQVAADGEFVFPDRLLEGSRYAVAVLTQPTSPNQTCTIRGGAGTIDGGDAFGIAVECTRNRYRIGGTVFGLPKETDVALRINGKSDLVVGADGEFTFPSPLEDGSRYEVTVSRHPGRPNWACTVENGAGILAGSDVITVDIGCFPEVNLQAVPGRRKVELTWNSDDFTGGTFNLCWAREDFSGLGFGNCADARKGALESRVKIPVALSPLINDTAYWFQLEVETPGGRRTLSKMVKAVPFGGLNDTGIDWCADDSANRDQGGTRVEKSGSCETLASTHPGQDARFGRDGQARARALTKTGGGSTGFDFTKICLSGEAAGQGKCPPNPALGNEPNNWGCTRDNVTGLLWEIKTTGGLRSQENTYSWHNPEKERNGGDAGVQNGGSCEGSGCDTRAYVQAVNASGFCGASDWRLPTRKELLSIVDNSRVSPAIDTGFFPNTPAANFWSSTPYVDQENSAWTVFFQYGEVYPAGKGQGHHLRLVRGRTATFGLENR